MRSRNYCYTLNNYSEEEENALQNVECKYHVYGRECESTPHLQGYIEFNDAMRITALKKINERIHWEMRMGTAKEASDYCKKDGNFFEKGVMSAQGKRSDLDTFARSAIECKDMQKLTEDFPGMMLRYSKQAQMLIGLSIEVRKAEPYVEWRWGKAGVGKTRYVWDLYDVKSVYLKDNTKWWDGYTGQEIVLIDDICVFSWNFRDLLKLLDRYPLKVECKGGYVTFNSPKIYITCEHEPAHYWNGNALAQVLRRITSVTEVTGNTEP